MKRTIACVAAWDGANLLPYDFEVLRRAGFGGVELVLGDVSPHDKPALEKQSQQASDPNRRDPALGFVSFLAPLHQHGLAITSCNISSGNPLDRQTLEVMKQKLEIAHHWGVHVVVAEAGDANTHDERTTLLANLRELADEAARRGMVVALDTQPGLMQHWRSMLATLSELDRSNLRINFDPANIVLYNENAQVDTSLARVCHLVAHVHLRNCLGFQRRSYGELGRGTAVDFFRIRELLDVCGFSGPYGILLEQRPQEPNPSPENCLEQLQQSRKLLDWCGYFD